MISAEIRRKIAERAKHRCEYCRIPARYSTATFNVEHIIPESLGGQSTLDNLAYSCPGCNAHKGVTTTSIDRTTGIVVPLFNPRVDVWEEHFEWQLGGAVILGTTAIGRATVERLCCNRDELMNLRELMLAVNVSHFGEP